MLKKFCNRKPKGKWWRGSIQTSYKLHISALFLFTRQENSQENRIEPTLLFVIKYFSLKMSSFWTFFFYKTFSHRLYTSKNAIWMLQHLFINNHDDEKYSCWFFFSKRKSWENVSERKMFESNENDQFPKTVNWIR